MKRTYYVNSISNESTNNKLVVGLFSKCIYTASENFHSEYYHCTKLLAKYEIHEEGIYRTPFDYKKPYVNYTKCNTWKWNILIGSHFCARIIVAKNDEEARKLFKEQNWEEQNIWNMK